MGSTIIRSDVTIVEGWRLLYLDQFDATVLIAFMVYNHPKLGTNHTLRTSEVTEVGEDDIGVYAQTRNTKYYLGIDRVEYLRNHAQGML